MPQTTCHQREEPTSLRDLKIGKKLKIVGAISIAIFFVSFFPFFSALNESLITYLKIIWWAVFLGLIIGGFIEYYVPEEFIFKYLGQRRKRTIFYAVAFGFIMSACSHGILAIAIQLFKKGAGIPAVIAFLLAAPWANLPVTILLFSFFGVKALIFIFSAMLIALITGFIYLLLEKTKIIEQSREVSIEQEYDWKRLKHFNLIEGAKGIMIGAVNLANMVLWWILIGFLLASVIGAYVPTHFFHQYLGPTFFGLLMTLLFATVLEICSEGSSPIAFEIFSKVGALGNPFVFLMAGVATDYTEIGLIWQNIGKKSAIFLPLITVPQIMALGILFNFLNL